MPKLDLDETEILWDTAAPMTVMTKDFLDTRFL